MLNENKNNISNQIVDLQSNARRFCFLIDHIDGFNHQKWLTEISQILPRIHAVIGMIDGISRNECLFSLSDIDERFELFCRLKKIIGDVDGYEIGEELTENQLYGSLSDDLTDLYFEIKRGLDLISDDSENVPAALSMWRDGFFMHWGKHLIDAEKHLYDLRVHHQI
ncbi:MAG: DUF5063 domain-containing protein [Piscirickettsiaceae bacterium]|nr:MAG: DUF5063 domain-containing protein [Piscirickettsiaceae bacterium]